MGFHVADFLTYDEIGFALSRFDIILLLKCRPKKTHKSPWLWTTHNSFFKTSFILYVLI